MRHAIEEAERLSQAEEVAKDQEDDLLADVEPAGEPLGVSLTELLVRQTLSDLENRLTADHHLDNVEDDRRTH